MKTAIPCGLLLTMIACAAHGAITFFTGGTASTGYGEVSSQPGTVTIGFDDVVLNTQGTTYTYTGGGTTATFTGLSASPNGSIVTGNASGKYAAPSGDTSQYLAVGQPTNAVVTMTLSTPIAYFGLYWSTPDNYNTITFLDAGGMSLGTYTPSVTPGFISAGSSTPYVNFEVLSGNKIASVQFSSSSRSFEIDNIAIAVPEPSVCLLMSSGALAAFAFGRLKRR